MQIGKILEALMRETGLNLTQVAERVRAQGAENVRYQHIQGLVDFPNRVPRYLPQLARAFGMTVEQLLMYQPGTPVEVNELRAPYQPSHALGSDPQILAASYQLVRLACKSLEISFDPEVASDANLVMLGCSYLAARAEREVTPDNVVDFTQVLRRVRERNAVEGNASDGSAGTGIGGEGQTRNAS